ncbi:MAG: hypothetical protein JSU82_15485 [Rhodospirillales bacterium]|nr:MAG: hypothetical protein JSU82_15485 [Rhodospirillales bacterium]
MTEVVSVTKAERQTMMKSIMEQFFGGMGTDEKKEMCATMMGKMTEGLDMKEMMPRMMMGMMSGGAGGGAGKISEMMPRKMSAGAEQQTFQMPEMMLRTMMPHCIGMMLPAIDPEKRGEVAAAILSAIVDKGSVGMSDEQLQSFRRALEDVVRPPS